MSGHSKWHTIKHKKGALDAKRGKIFTKMIKEITVAARTGGSGDVDSNARLRKAVTDAKAQNMPNDTIDRAIKRGMGELEGANYDEVTYEGYGPNGVAVMVEAMTDNRNRTVAEIRHIFSKNGGNMGESGSVGWMFDKKGYIVVDKAAKSRRRTVRDRDRSRRRRHAGRRRRFRDLHHARKLRGRQRSHQKSRHRTAGRRNLDDPAKLHPARRQRRQDKC